ncbi:hypothetical protein VPH35_092685 [Triticum aestivum]
MKRKNTTDLRSFLERVAAKKKKSEPTSATPSSNESQLQLVMFQGQSGSETHTIPPEPERAPNTESPIAEDDDESMTVDGSHSTDEDSDDDIYDIVPDPGLRTPVSSYDVNDQDSVRRAYIALGRCKPKMELELLKLVLVLPVATAGVKRVFSSMNYIKNKLRSKMGQKYLNDCLVTFVERDFFFQVKDEDIITPFQSIKDRKVTL